MGRRSKESAISNEEIIAALLSSGDKVSKKA